MMFFWTVPLYALPFRCLANSTACAFAPPPFRGSAIAPFLRNAARPSMAAYDQKKSIQQSPVTLNLIQGLYRPSVRSLCFVNKVQKIPPLGSLLYRTTKPRHPELDSGSVPPSMALCVLAIRCKKSLRQSPVTLNLIQGLYRHPCALYLLPRKPPLPEPVEGTFFQKNVTCKRPGNILKQDYRAARK